MFSLKNCLGSLFLVTLLLAAPLTQGANNLRVRDLTTNSSPVATDYLLVDNTNGTKKVALGVAGAILSVSTANYSLTADTAVSANYASSANYAEGADHAILADSAAHAEYANRADYTNHTIVEESSDANAPPRGLYFSTDTNQLAFRVSSGSVYYFTHTGTTINVPTTTDSGEVTPDEEIVGTSNPNIAFTGAAGFGANTKGAFGKAGTNPTIYHVTNLNDSGAGSLRYGIENVSSAIQPCIIVFDIGGRIALTRDIVVGGNYLTIAGQTAPTNSGGICISGAALDIRGHDIILRGLRIRNGTYMTSDSAYGYERKNSVLLRDFAAYGYGHPHDIIIDHCSISWAADENLTMWENWGNGYGYNLTIQYCFINEGLRSIYGFSGNGHSANALVGYYFYNIDFHHNFFSHSTARNPECNAGSKVLFANNVVFGWTWRASQFTGAEPDKSSIRAPQYFDCIENYYKYDSTQDDALEKPIYLYNKPSSGWSYINTSSRLYVYKNYHNTLNPSYSTGSDASLVTGDDLGTLSSYISGGRTVAIPSPDISITDPVTAKNDVLANAGCRQGASGLDSVDQGYITDFNNGTAYIHGASWRPTFPSYARGTTPADADGDGLTDTYEIAICGNNGGVSPFSINAETGYTYMEDYLNSLVVGGLTN